MKIKKSTCAIATVFMLGIVPAAKADFEKGLEYYRAGNFQHAYQEFDAAAKEGERSSQFNLGVMYYRGEFVEKDLIAAYAWLAMASSAEEFQQMGLHKTIYQSLDRDAQKKAKDLYTKYMYDYARIRYHSNDLSDQEWLPSARKFNPISTPKPIYPRQVIRNLGRGTVDVRYTIHVDGSVGDYVIQYSPDPLLTKATIDALKKWKYAPLDASSYPHGLSSVRLQFVFKLNVDNQNIINHLAELKAKAEFGTAREQLEYAVNFDFGFQQFDDVEKKQVGSENTRYWLLRAANAGNLEASYLFGISLINNSTKPAQITWGKKWLEDAAKRNLIDAQIEVARQLITANRSLDEVQQGIQYLRNCSESKTAVGDLSKVLLARELIESPHAKLRNPEEALQVITSVDEKYLDQRKYLRTRAAVHAANKQFNEAQIWIKKAIREAKECEHDVDDLVAMETDYLASQKN